MKRKKRKKIQDHLSNKGKGKKFQNSTKATEADIEGYLHLYCHSIESFALSPTTLAKLYFYSDMQ